MDFVIGSGPAGIACATGLLANGRTVTLLDAGLTLEPEREQLRAAMAPRDKDEWRDYERRARSIVLASGEMPEFKLTHGSDYPYRTPSGAPAIRIGAPGLAASYAQGGLSNVWGAAMLPFRAQELADWPLTEADLAPAYRAVLQFLPLAGVEDDLSEDWPLYTSRPHELPASRQSVRLLARLERHRAALQRGNIRFGRARIGMDPTGERLGLPCIACGECLNGCPRDLIFSTRHELTRLKATGRLNYLSGIVVRQLEESANAVQIRAVDAAGVPLIFEGERVFVGAGVFGTTALMLRSLGMTRAKIKDSQYYLFPLLQWHATRGVVDERLHTMAQIFLEIEDQEISPHNIHLQVYSYNDLLKTALAGKLGRLGTFFPKNAFLERMMVVQGYLHSDHSGWLEAQLADDMLTVTVRRRPETRKVLGRLLRRMIRFSWEIGALPLTALLEETVPGRGYHTGGSFPMSYVPGPGETDRLGRPFGRRRTHIIDSSVFPSIPAATITLSVMANAWRIGYQAAANGDFE